MAKIAQNFLMQNQPNPILAPPKNKIEYQGKFRTNTMPKTFVLNQSQCNLTLEPIPSGIHGKDIANSTIIKRNKLDFLKKDDNNKEKVKESDNLANKTKKFYRERSKKLLKDIENSTLLPHLNNESAQHDEKDKKRVPLSSIDYELEKDKEIPVYFSSKYSLVYFN